MPHDISGIIEASQGPQRVPNNGTLILPLSINALHGYQSAPRVYDFLEFFVKKVQQVTNDVVLL